MRVVANRAAETITAAVRKRFSSLIIELPVQQAGSGDPSPDNIRPIAQWTDVELYVADTDTATEPTVTTTLPTPIFGGMVDVARGEVASLYNEKKSSSGWEMVEEGQFRCQVGAFNNGDETSTNVADLYSSHYKTVSNKDAYDATDDLTCGTPTIEGVTYLYVNDLDYTTLEAFTAYIGDVQFVYKSHIPMSDEIAPTIVYLPEGTSYVWATASYEILTVTGTPPLELPNAAPRPVEQFEVSFTPVQDLHGYDSPWPAGGGGNKLPISVTDFDNWGVKITQNGDYIHVDVSSSTSGYYPFTKVATIPSTWSDGDYYLKESTTSINGLGFRIIDRSFSPAVTINVDSNNKFTLASPRNDYDVEITIIGGQTPVGEYDVGVGVFVDNVNFTPYSNLCPITGHTEATGKIDSMYGGDITWNQRAKEINATNWPMTNGNATYNNGVATLVATGNYGRLDYRFAEAIPAEHYYLITVTAKTNFTHSFYPLNFKIGISRYVSEATPVANEWKTYARIYKDNSTADSPYVYIGDVSNFYQQGDVVEVKDCMYFDLTVMFGAGNEPTTVEEFRALFPNDYYAYNAGTVTTVGAVNGRPHDSGTVSLGTTVYGGTADVVGGDGSETWVKLVPSITSLQSINEYGIANFVFTFNPNINISPSPAVMCTALKRQSTTIAQTIDEGYLVSNTMNGYIRLYSTRASTVAEANQWIADNDCYFVYVPTTSTDFTFTPTTLSTSQGDNYAWSDTNGTTMTVSYWGKEQ